MDKTGMNELINSGVNRIFDDISELREYLRMLSDMYFMSAGNIAAIYAQYPPASKVLSLKMWKKNNVSVSPQQQGIYISLTDTNAEENTIKLYERYVTVFDIAQTDSEYANTLKSIHYYLEIVKNLYPTAEALLPADNEGCIKDGLIVLKKTRPESERLSAWVRMYFQIMIYSGIERDMDYKNFIVSCCTCSVLSCWGIDMRIYNPYISGNIEMLCDIHRFVYDFWTKFYLYESGGIAFFDFFECSVINRNLCSFKKDDFTQRLSLLEQTSREYAEKIKLLNHKVSALTDAAFEVMCSDVKEGNIVSTKGYLCSEYSLETLI